MKDSEIIEIIEIVEELNSHIYDIDCTPEHSFSWCTNGYFSVIMFDDYVIWSSEDDARKLHDNGNDREPLDTCIKRLFNEYLEDINRFKFKRLKKFKVDDE